MEAIKCFGAKKKFVKIQKLKFSNLNFNVLHNGRANFYSLLESLTLGIFLKLHCPDAYQYDN